MKILAIHNFHRKGSASGDDQVFKSETKLLEEKGNTVIRYSTINDSFDRAGIIGKFLTVLGMFWSQKHYNAVHNLIQKEQPDIIHIHTFFPLLSPSVLYAAHKSGVPTVATLHDTRFVCPCATSLRGTQLCNQCGDGNYFRMVRYGCFKNSRLQSLVVACIFKFHRVWKSFYNQIDKYICLNDNQIALLKASGFDGSKIVKKYNFVPDEAADIEPLKLDGLPPRYAVFYGRIGVEKGVHIIMDIWEELPEVPLVIMGGGPLEEEVRTWAERKENVFFLGYTPHEKCMAIVKNGEFVVFPSIWYEGCSMVEIETQSLGLPLIATDLGFSEEAIQEGFDGYKIPLGDKNGFVKRIRALWSDPERCKQMGKHARMEYEKKYRPDDNFRQLMEVYRSFEIGE